MDALWPPLADAVHGPGAAGDLLDDVNSVRGLGGLAGESYVDKDLRTLLGDRVEGRFNLRYCGEGSLSACRDSLWTRCTQRPTAWRRSSATRIRPRG